MTRRYLCICIALAIPLSNASSQNAASFDVAAYKAFLSANQYLEPAQLQSMYPAGRFSNKSASSNPWYLDSIDYRYHLTSYEKQLLADHGFVVTSRLPQQTMISAFADIYTKDLPVFVSTDAILEAVHFSYDRILMDIEKGTIIPALNSLLSGMRGQLPTLAQRYSADPRMMPKLRDLDVYLTVPLKLLGNSIGPYFSQNDSVVAVLLQLIAKQHPADVKLFADIPRTIDFSQFTVRGHYTQSPELSQYFQAMMWLGRTEIYLIPPSGTTILWPDSCVQRQAVDAILVVESLKASNTQPTLQMIDSLVSFMVGESDNVNVTEMESLMAEANVDSAGSMLDTATFHSFQDILREKSYAFQRINSQILMKGWSSPDGVQPASAFMLLGQRFVIDSYVTGNVVFDKITYQGQLVKRMLPSTLDVLFTLGNNAALQILDPELQHYHYAPNLAALRYLVDSYDDDFWNCSLFNCWLSIIRTLNPPQVRSTLPGFMQTGAWWQEKMNTQLASWAQLRHDNLLYAKQSYTTGFIVCSYPQSYVEPVPEFYARVKKFAGMAAPRFAALGVSSIPMYFNFLSAIADTLGTIAQKELAGTALEMGERDFLKRMMSLYTVEGGCSEGGPQYQGYSGWYPRLFYGVSYGVDALSHPELTKTDFIVADVHTSPTDSEGNPVGWVLHVGAGPIDLAIVTASTPGGEPCAFIGPVLNYYERITEKFQRLTDEEWTTLCTMAPTIRPAFVNLYLADEHGQSRGAGPELLTGISDETMQVHPGSYVLYQNYPNPFNPSTFITFTVPWSSKGEQVKLDILDVRGARIAGLIDERLGSGSYVVRWDGHTSVGSAAASGIYFYRLRAGTVSMTRKMILLR